MVDFDSWTVLSEHSIRLFRRRRRRVSDLFLQRCDALLLSL